MVVPSAEWKNVIAAGWDRRRGCRERTRSALDILSCRGLNTLRYTRRKLGKEIQTGLFKLVAIFHAEVYIVAIKYDKSMEPRRFTITSDLCSSKPSCRK